MDVDFVLQWGCTVNVEEVVAFRPLQLPVDGDVQTGGQWDVVVVQVSVDRHSNPGRTAAAATSSRAADDAVFAPWISWIRADTVNRRPQTCRSHHQHFFQTGAFVSLVLQTCLGKRFAVQFCPWTFGDGKFI